MRPPLDIARLLDLGFLDLGFLDLGFRYLGSTISGSALATAFLFFTVPAMAAEVSADRLINADREPQNWLMNHRTYDAQRFSPLDKINKANVKSLKL